MNIVSQHDARKSDQEIKPSNALRKRVTRALLPQTCRDKTRRLLTAIYNMSPYSLFCANADIANDWDELFASFYTSWSNPIQPVSQLTFAHLGTNTPAERTACQKAKVEPLEEAELHSDTVFWIKCTDTTTGKIVGGMCYKHERNWPSGDSFAPTWFDDGSEMRRLS